VADLGCTLTLTLAKVKSWRKERTKERRLSQFLCNVLVRRGQRDGGEAEDDDGDEAEREEKRKEESRLSIVQPSGVMKKKMETNWRPSCSTGSSLTRARHSAN
jgi:hypothetical protein